MKNFDVNVFVESIWYDSYQVYYDGYLLFFEGYNNKPIATFKVMIWGQGIYENEHYIERDSSLFGEAFYYVEKDTIEECIEEFLKAKIWNGKTFWEVQDDFIVFP